MTNFTLPTDNWYQDQRDQQLTPQLESRNQNQPSSQSQQGSGGSGYGLVNNTVPRSSGSVVNTGAGRPSGSSSANGMEYRFSVPSTQGSIQGPGLIDILRGSIVVNPRGSWATNGSITLPTLPSVTSSVNSLHSRGSSGYYSDSATPSFSSLSSRGSTQTYQTANSSSQGLGSSIPSVLSADPSDVEWSGFTRNSVQETSNPLYSVQGPGSLQNTGSQTTFGYAQENNAPSVSSGAGDNGPFRTSLPNLTSRSSQGSAQTSGSIQESNNVFASPVIWQSDNNPYSGGASAPVFHPARSYHYPLFPIPGRTSNQLVPSWFLSGFIDSQAPAHPVTSGVSSNFNPGFREPSANYVYTGYNNPPRASFTTNTNAPPEVFRSSTGSYHMVYHPYTLGGRRNAFALPNWGFQGNRNSGNYFHFPEMNTSEFAMNKSRRNAIMELFPGQVGQQSSNQVDSGVIGQEDWTGAQNFPGQEIQRQSAGERFHLLQFGQESEVDNFAIPPRKKSRNRSKKAFPRTETTGKQPIVPETPPRPAPASTKSSNGSLSDGTHSTAFTQHPHRNRGSQMDYLAPSDVSTFWKNRHYPD